MFGVERSYISEFAVWMNDLESKNPEWLSGREQGRALWWDQKPAFLAKGDSCGDPVPPKAYPYDVNFPL